MRATRRAHRFGNWAATATRHSPWEDALGVVAGVTLTAVGIAILGSLGFLTGGMAGLAFVAHYLTGWNFGLVFFVLNLPFYALAIGRMGRAFTIKTAFAVALLSLMTGLSADLLRLAYIDPLFGACLGGLLLGFGLLALFRHRASAGGVGILAIFLQDKFGWRAGLTQLAVDMVVLVTAFAAVSPRAVAYSVLGALVLNLFLAINHRTDRYLAA
ncbi:YitT family protein [Jeongeupella avenae]|uniref:YitT family protein n=1 Tax=Antarcticirhabdus aurantiaca TaxID=2606717 RepID=A0ACD4NXQ1_9HYPH|nr:YitT family protein [Antarcticirhabdus aurantiaca]WAJ31520.1 YitT family protein [Jeongeuplla avenae]